MERNVAPTTPDLTSLDCWDYTIELECLRGPQDLQLAAELGKTLLERNKELETSLRQQQNVVEDRDQEIEYLTKQTAALREVNDSRLRIYEQLEISIQDLERNNQRLVQESANDKKHIKSLYETIDSLESRCEDLQRLVDDMGRSAEKDGGAVGEDGAGGGGGGGRAVDDQDDWRRLVTQLEHAKNQRAKEQRKVSELEQNVSLLVQENTSLEEKVCVMQRKDEELKTLQDQIVYLEEIRQGNLCRRCQRSTDPNLFDECSVYDDDDDTDDISAIGSYVETHKHEVLQQLQETLGENYSEDNPYRILVDKYEALLKIQQKHNAFTGTCATPPSTKDNQNQGISLHEELQMSGQFSSFNGNASEDSNDDDDDDDPVAVTGKRSAGGENEAAAAQCKYSETDTTSSSGFSDETSNKCTQTAETSFFAGSFLCTISDGDDCRFSIYDDASPVESRFRKTPEYRHLFREIFAVLKRAAEAKDEGERLPLLQDDGDETCGRDPPPPPALPKVPPTTPAGEHDPLSFARADERCPATASAHEDQDEQRRRRPEEPGQTPRRRRDIIDELASAVKHKKHARHRKPASRQQSRDISHLMDFKWSDQEVVTRRPRNRAGDDDRPTTTSSCHGAAAWCAPADGGEDAATPYASSASQEVAKLKLLEKSYAEVLRLTKPPSNRPQSQYFNRT